MSEFGASTGKQREYLNGIESVALTTDSISDEGKNIWQHSIAYIQSYDGPVYTVNVEKENVQIHALLGTNIKYWTEMGIPASGDKVIIRHKKDYFKATIESVLDKDNNYDVILFARKMDPITGTEKLEGRYQDASIKKNDTLWNEAWNTLNDIYFSMISAKNRLTKQVN